MVASCILDSIKKLKVLQNAALRTVTGCTQDTNIQHLHDETPTHPISVLSSKIFKKSPHFCFLCTSWQLKRGGSLLRRSYRLVITSSTSAGTGSSCSLCRPDGMWYDAALRRTVQKIFSSYMLRWHCTEAQCVNTKRRLLLFS